MKTEKILACVLLPFSLAAILVFTSCGGGSSSTTTISGNITEVSAFSTAKKESFLDFFKLIKNAYAQAADLVVCIRGTDSCTITDETGSFILEAEIAGEVCLDIAEGQALFCISNIEAGSIIVVQDISCDEVSGECRADEIEIEAPELLDPSEPSVSEPSISDPSLDEPSISEPSISEPSLDEPSLSEPSISEPSLDEPSLSEPSISEPSLDEPSISEPSVSEPSIS